MSFLGFQKYLLSKKHLDCAHSVFYDGELCCTINFTDQFDESECNHEYLEQLIEEGFSDEVEQDISSVANYVDVEEYGLINKRRNDSQIKEGIYFDKTKKIFREYLTNSDVYCKYPLEELNLGLKRIFIGDWLSFRKVLC